MFFTDGWCIVCITKGVKTAKTSKGVYFASLYKWSSPYDGSCPPSIKTWPLCSSQWLKGHKVWLKPTALWAYKHARWKPWCCGIFCSRFHPILSPLKIILEMVFWTNLMLDLICTWLEKTRRFCRQVNKKISSCFWTASTCVQRSSLGWCSRLTYMETVDWIHVGMNALLVQSMSGRLKSPANRIWPLLVDLNLDMDSWSSFMHACTQLCCQKYATDRTYRWWCPWSPGSSPSPRLFHTSCLNQTCGFRWDHFLVQQGHHHLSVPLYLSWW